MSSEPTFAPSSLNCTPTTPTLSEAVAATLAVPETVAPAVGLVSPTDGAVVSLGGGVLEFDTVTLRCELELLPAASRATAVSECPPFETLAVFQLSE